MKSIKRSRTLPHIAVFAKAGLFDSRSRIAMPGTWIDPTMRPCSSVQTWPASLG